MVWCNVALIWVLLSLKPRRHVFWRQWPIHNNQPRREKPLLGILRTTKALTSLCIRADLSAHLLFTYCKLSHLNLLQVNPNCLYSLCGLGDCLSLTKSQLWRRVFSRWDPLLYYDRQEVLIAIIRKYYILWKQPRSLFCLPKFVWMVLEPSSTIIYDICL